MSTISNLKNKIIDAFTPKPSQEFIDSLVKNSISNPNNKAIKEELAKASKRDPAGVMVSIIKNQSSLYSRDLVAWQAARQSALDVDNPNRADLVQFYKDIELDPFIYGIVYPKRILKISNREFKIAVGDDEKEAKEKTKLFKNQWFTDFLKYAMQSQFHGTSLIYFYEWLAGRIKTTSLVFRENVLPERNMVNYNAYITGGFNYTKPPFSNYMIHVGKPYELGLYEKAAILYILKKHSWANWDEFEEIFGVPMRIAKLASQDPKVKAEVDKWMREMGSASYGIFPIDAQIEVKESTRSDAFNVFFKKIEQANFELEVLFTGQNRVTQKGGSFAKEQVMESESDELLDDDKTFIANIVNDQLIPLLIRNGYPLTPEDRFVWDDAEQVTTEVRLKIYQGVKLMGFELDEEQVSAEFNVKITGKTEPANQNNKDGEIDPAIKNWVKMHSQINSMYFNAPKPQ